MQTFAIAKTQKGFTLIELLVVITIVGIISSIAIPNLLSARASSNEAAAIATLRLLASAQVSCSNRRFIDSDNDGRGEYGFFGELSGGTPARNQGGGQMLPPMLATSFQTLAAGSVWKSGYVYRVYLPNAAGNGVEETNGNYPLVDADLAEDFWCAYAWPANASAGGNAYFVNQQGEILRTTNDVQAYSGDTVVPAPDAVFGTPNLITTAYNLNVATVDGGNWKLVQ